MKAVLVLAAIAWPAALIGVAATPDEGEAQSRPLRDNAGDSISVSQFGITEVDQLAVAAGRFLWVSGPRQGIAVIDLETGIGAAIGRAGSGPGEYRMVSHVFGCESNAGWVDDQLHRVTWLSPAGTGQPRSRQLPAGILARARTLDALCDEDVLWLAVERQGVPVSGLRTDSLDVLRLDPTGAVDTIATFPGTVRRLRSRGALRTSLRVPYKFAPIMVRSVRQTIMIGRTSDSIWTLGPGGIRSTAIIGDGSSRTLTLRYLPVVRDSIASWYEAEMESQRYAPELRGEFRTVIAELLREVELPARLPYVRLASAIPGDAGEVLVAENDYPGSRRTCISTLALTGALKRILCRTWTDRIVTAIQAVGEEGWLAQWNDNDAWVMRIRLPSRQ